MLEFRIIQQIGTGRGEIRNPMRRVKRLLRGTPTTALVTA
jgi:hypothetical protein